MENIETIALPYSLFFLLMENKVEIRGNCMRVGMDTDVVKQKASGNIMEGPKWKVNISKKLQSWWLRIRLLSISSKFQGDN